MKRFIPILGFVICAGLIASCVIGAQPQPAPKSKVLFEVGGPVHDNPELYAMMKKALEDTGRYEVTVTDNRDLFVPDRIKAFDVVLIYTTSGSLSAEQEKGLVEFVQNGKAVVGIHSATDSFHNSDAYWKMMCGSFIGHGRDTFTVRITGKSHPIVRDMKDFKIEDETYRHKWHPDSKPIVLMRREFDGEPASWVQYYGKGRVFVTGLGHGVEAWSNPAFQEMMIRAMDWATKRLNP